MVYLGSTSDGLSWPFDTTQLDGLDTVPPSATAGVVAIIENDGTVTFAAVPFDAPSVASTVFCQRCE